MRQTLPWESVPPPIYVSRPPKPRKKWVTVGGWILVVLLLLFGLMSKRSNLPLSVISFGLALLYTLTLLTKKDAVVNTRGLEIFYQMQITTQYDFFPWEQINSIVMAGRPSTTRQIMYSSIKLPPPFWPHIQGNFQTLPQPMAHPADSMIKPKRLLRRSRSFINQFSLSVVISAQTISVRPWVRNL